MKFFNETETFKKVQFQRRVPIDGLLLIVWLKMIWDGTSYDKLFKKSNLVIIILIGTVDFSFYIWTLIMSRDLFKKDFEEKNYTQLEELHLIWLYSLSMFGNFSIYFIFI